MTDQPTAPPANPPAPASSSAPTLEQLAARQAATDQKLDRTDSKIDDVLSLLRGKGTPAPAADPAAPAADMAEQMRQAVRDVQAETAAAAPPAAPAPETPPREVLVRGKARLQRRLFGDEPKK